MIKNSDLVASPLPTITRERFRLGEKTPMPFCAVVEKPTSRLERPLPTRASRIAPVMLISVLVLNVSGCRTVLPSHESPAMETVTEPGMSREEILAYLDGMEDRAKEMMNISPEGGRFLHDLVIERGHKRGLEIGTSNGYSTIWLAMAFRETGGRIITVEFDPHRGGLARENFAHLDMWDVIELRLDDAFRVIPRLEGEFDFIYIDAWKQDYRKFFDLVYPLTAVGGVIVADNLYSGAAINQDSVDLLSAFAGHAALAIENAELYHQLEEKIDQLEHAQEELLLAERLAVIGEMSARMAHEIRNPMTTIGGFARSILKKPEPERVETAARVILEETERLEKLLADTLSFTRPSRPEFAYTDLHRLIGDVRTLVEADLQGHNITYHENVSPDLPALDADAAQIKQVLINILQNAVQAMPDGGQLTLNAFSAPPPEAVGDDDAGRPDFLPAPEAEWVLLEVADTGEGIPAETQEQIFSPFFSTKTYGTGLGLAICKKIVDDHAGVLVIQGAPDQGTSVRIYLPSQISHQEGQYDEDPVDC